MDLSVLKDRALNLWTTVYYGHPTYISGRRFRVKHQKTSTDKFENRWQTNEKRSGATDVPKRTKEDSLGGSSIAHQLFLTKLGLDPPRKLYEINVSQIA